MARSECACLVHTSSHTRAHRHVPLTLATVSPFLTSCRNSTPSTPWFRRRSCAWPWSPCQTHPRQLHPTPRNCPATERTKATHTHARAQHNRWVKHFKLIAANTWLHNCSQHTMTECGNQSLVLNGSSCYHKNSNPQHPLMDVPDTPCATGMSVIKSIIKLRTLHLFPTHYNTSLSDSNLSYAGRYY